MSSTSSEPNKTKATNREHNQGRQDRAYTSAQASAVERVRKCKTADYYAILDIETTATESEIRKAYRKLALVMHPDKNGAPGADEAFKMVAKAFQVLSDADKKRIFDQTGSDPDSRGAGMGGGGFSGFSRARANPGGGGGAGAPAGFDEDFAEELFRSFFGGGGGMGPGVHFQGFGPFANVRTFQFGGPAAAAGPRRAPRPAANGGNQDFTSNLIRLLPLLLLFVTPLLSSLFDSATGNSGVENTRFEFTSNPPYTEQRSTARYNIPYYLRPQDVQKLSAKGLKNVGSRAEVTYIHSLQSLCDREYEIRQQKIMDAHGWFTVDLAAKREAEQMEMPHCDRLRKLGLSNRR